MRAVRKAGQSLPKTDWIFLSLNPFIPSKSTMRQGLLRLQAMTPSHMLSGTA